MQSSGGPARQPQEVTDDDILRAGEKIAADLELANKKIAAYEAQLAAKDDIIRLEREKGAVKDEIIATQAEALEARRASHAKDDEIKASFERSLEMAEKRIAELVAEVARLKAQRKWIAVLSAIGGAVVGSQADKDDD